MKFLPIKVILILISFLQFLVIIRCTPPALNPKDISYTLDIKDSLLFPVTKDFGNKFIYVILDTVLLKADYKEFIAQTDSFINFVRSELYREAYQELKDTVIYKFEYSDSLDISSLNHKLQGRSLSIIMLLINNQQLAVFSEFDNTFQDSIWIKEFYAESFYQDSLRLRFYNGYIYGLKNGYDFLSIETSSGH